jgi:hypothetical protein
VTAFSNERDAGIGFEFSRNDPFCGVDLDKCRDKDSGQVAEWARTIIKRMDTYTEVSPSGTGVKMWCEAKSPFPTGRQIMLDKGSRIEVYDYSRYFAVTGLRLAGVSPEIEVRSLDWILQQVPSRVKCVPAVDRARLYIDKIPGAVAGNGGHNVTFYVACCLVLGFDLSVGVAFPIISEWNAKCNPPWDDKDLHHKLNDASSQLGRRGYLLNGENGRPKETNKVDRLEKKYDRLVNGLARLVEDMRHAESDSQESCPGQGGSTPAKGLSGAT